MSLKTAIARVLRDESGATAVEYGLLTALISVALIATLNAVSAGMNDTYSTIETQLADNIQ